MKQGRSAKIDIIMKKIDEILEILIDAQMSYNDSHPDRNPFKLIDSYRHIAALYNARDDDTNALKYYLKALNIQKRELGEDHYDIASTCRGIAEIYDDLGNGTIAKKWHGKELAILDVEKEKLEDDIAYAYDSIAYIYGDDMKQTAASRAQGKTFSYHQNEHPVMMLVKACPVHRCVSEIAFDEELICLFSDIASVCGSIAETRSDNGEVDAAREWRKRAKSVSNSECRIMRDIALICMDIAKESDCESENGRGSALEWYISAISLLEQEKRHILNSIKESYLSFDLEAYFNLYPGEFDFK